MGAGEILDQHADRDRQRRHQRGHERLGAVRAVVQEQHEPDPPRFGTGLGVDRPQAGGDPLLLVAHGYGHDRVGTRDV